jgi:hypothetical protein
MSVVIIDGRVKVTWCTSIASVAAPTTTELNAGTALQNFITPDGLDIAASTGKVKTSNLGSTFTTNKAGRRAFDIKITFHHDSGTDTAWLLVPYNTDGFLVVRRGILATTAWASSDKVAVYPVNTAEPDEVKPAEDSTWDFMVEMFLSADPNTRAVVA